MQVKHSVSAPLRAIEFIGNPLTDDMLDSLYHTLTDHETLSSLQTVDLMDNNLGESRARRLISNLEVSKAKEIRLRFNNIGKDGCDGLASVVNISPCIRMLDVRGNELVAADVRKLFKAIGASTTVTHLNVCRNKLSEEGAEMAARFLEKNTYLQFLDFSANDLGSSGAEHIATLLSNPTSTLRVVLLYGNCLGEVGMQRVCAAMQTNKEVVQLNLGCNNATDAAAGSIADMLARNETLLDLDICLNTITDVGIQRIAADGLANNYFLQSLCLSGNPLGSSGANMLVKALLSNTRSALERLNLSSCSLGPTGGIHLASFLCRSQTLKDLNLADNQLNDESASAIAQATSNSISISAVDVSMNPFGEPAAVCFLEAVQLNPHLSSVILDGNRASRATQHKWRATIEEWLGKNRSENKDNFSCANGLYEVSRSL
ncbi:unnamed protein product [Phytomonas sp. EM1]|nr:unnamed protein product [Phytomonas sp. EM1]|eukprot:CCW64103.1 unnamed protein product [Phytomonas sp. isolate EM1]